MELVGEEGLGCWEVIFGCRVPSSLWSTASREIPPQGPCPCPQHWETLQTKHTFILLRVPLLVQLPNNCSAARMACFPSLLAVRILGNQLFLLFSGSTGCFSMLSGGDTVVPLELNCQVLRTAAREELKSHFWVLSSFAKWLF